MATRTSTPAACNSVTSEGSRPARREGDDLHRLDAARGEAGDLAVGEVVVESDVSDLRVREVLGDVVRLKMALPGDVGPERTGIREAVHIAHRGVSGLNDLRHAGFVDGRTSGDADAAEVDHGDSFILLDELLVVRDQPGGVVRVVEHIEIDLAPVDAPVGVDRVEVCLRAAGRGADRCERARERPTAANHDGAVVSDFCLALATPGGTAREGEGRNGSEGDDGEKWTTMSTEHELPFLVHSWVGWERR